MNKTDFVMKYPELNIGRFGEQIRKWRKLANLTQEEFADYVGFGRTTVVAIEKKVSAEELSLDELYRLYYYFARSREKMMDSFYRNMIENIVSEIDEELIGRIQKRINGKQITRITENKTVNNAARRKINVAVKKDNSELVMQG